MIAICILSAILALFIAVILFRAFRFRPVESDLTAATPVDFDREGSVNALRELIRCRTISDVDSSKEDDWEFLKLKAKMSELYPTVFSKCENIDISSRAALLKWKGKGSVSPTVLMAHFDVVGVDESGWEHPPFDGVIADGYLWGRGTLDTKSTLSGILFAAETHIKGGFVPENDIYFAFSGNEEIGGGGAPSIVEWFIQNGVTPALVLDEGGAVVSGVFPGVKERLALIGIAEKGMLNVEYTAKSAGGHSSAPLKDSPIGRLSRACLRMEKKPFSFRITEPAAKMFDTLARHSGFGYRIIFANLWCFAPILNLITRLNGGELSAIVRTTTAFTMAEGATGMNVIPERARMISNHRIIPSETVESAVLGIQKRISDPEIDVKVVYGMDPSRVSRTDGDAWSRVASAARECFGDIIVSPYLMLACSDSRHFSKISDHVYRFSPMELSRDERALIHASNERISVAAIERIVEFYLRLIGKC